MAFIGDPRRTTSVLPLATSLAQTQMQLKQRQPHWMEVLGRVMGQVTGALVSERTRKEERVAAEAAMELEKRKVAATEVTANAKWFEALNEQTKLLQPRVFSMSIGENQGTIVTIDSSGNLSTMDEALISRAAGLVNAGDRWAIVDALNKTEIGSIPIGLAPEGSEWLMHEASGTLMYKTPEGEIRDASPASLIKWRESQAWYQEEKLKLATREVAVREERLVLDNRVEDNFVAYKESEARRDDMWRGVTTGLEREKFDQLVSYQAHLVKMDGLREERHRLKDLADIEVATSGMSRENMLARLEVITTNAEMDLAQRKLDLEIERERFDQVQTLYENASEEEKARWKMLVDKHAMLIKDIETDIAITGMEVEQSRLGIEELNAWKPEKMAWHEAWVKLQNEEPLNPGEMEILGIREPVAFVPTTMEEVLELHGKKIALNAKLGVGGAMTMEHRKELLDYERGIQAYMATLTFEQKKELQGILQGYKLEFLAEEADVGWEVTRKELILKADLKGQESFKADDGTWWQYNDEGKLEVLLAGAPEKPQVVNVRLDDGRVAVGIIYPGDKEVTWTDTFVGDTQAKQIEMISQAWVDAERQVRRQMGAFAMLDETLIPQYRREMTAAFVRTLESYGVPRERALALADPNWLLQAELGGAVFESGAQIGGVSTRDYITGAAIEGEGITFETPGGEPRELEVVETPKVEPGGKRLTSKEIASKTAVQVEAFKTLNNPQATKKLQQALKDAGVYRGEVDGVWSVAVERALEIAIRTNKNIADSLIIFKGSK